MKNKLVLVMLLFLATVSVRAQVTIGDTKISSPFSILELISDRNDNGYRGLRLPQLTTEEREAMEETNDFQNEKNDNAMGLQIYNTTTRCVETWNGSGWIQSCGEDGPRPATGKVAYLDGTDIKYRDFMSYNLGAQEISIKEQLLHDITAIINENTIPAADNQAEKEAYTKVYGSKYQWGRKSDGHQNVWIAAATTPTTGVPAANIDEYGQVKSGEAGYGQFVRNTAPKYDWIANDAPVSIGNYHSFPGRWDGGYDSSTGTYTPPSTPFPSSKVKVTNGNNPCPAGFRVPSKVEWEAIFTGGSWSGSVYSGGINKWVWVAKGATSVGGVDLEEGTVKTSGYLIYPAVDNTTSYTYYETPTLFLPAAGYRYYSGGSLHNGGRGGYYWSSTAYSDESDANGYNLLFNDGFGEPIYDDFRANGFSVRCVAD